MVELDSFRLCLQHVIVLPHSVTLQIADELRVLCIVTVIANNSSPVPAAELDPYIRQSK